MKTLSICIPTYNRARYLSDVIAQLLPQISGLPDDEVELLVSNNASTDKTIDILSQIHAPNFRYWTNPTNIGGDRNFLKCIEEARGEYVWLVGDDDSILPTAVKTILSAIKEHRPGLLISGRKGSTAVFDDYVKCVDHARPNHIQFVLNHTLITANVFSKRLFDMEFATQMLWTNYCQMFGLMKSLKENRVCVTDQLTQERPDRAPFDVFPSNLCIKQAYYLWYLSNLFDLPGFKWSAFKLACNLPLEYASRLKCFLLSKHR